MLILSNSFHIQPSHAQRTGFLDVNSINPHEGIHHGLATIGCHGVAHAVAYYINGHPFFNTDAAGEFRVFYCDSGYHSQGSSWPIPKSSSNAPQSSSSK